MIWEKKIIKKTISHVSETNHEYSPLMRVGIETYPIPFFGCMSDARVVTLGLNPSCNEFRNRKWDGITNENLWEKLVGYFASQDPPPHRYFGVWTAAISHINASYLKDTVHLDLSPRATRAAGQFQTEPSISLFIKMLREDAHIWLGAVEAMQEIEIILSAGSATKKYFINEFIKSELNDLRIRLEGDWQRGAGPGQTAFHTLILPSGREIPFFFCSTGPSAPGGGPILENALYTNAQRINKIRKSTSKKRG